MILLIILINIINNNLLHYIDVTILNNLFSNINLIIR